MRKNCFNCKYAEICRNTLRVWCKKYGEYVINPETENKYCFEQK